MNDVIGALEEGRSPILLTERRDHLEYFAVHLRGFTRRLVVLQGGTTAKARREAMGQLATIPGDEERLILATGRYIGAYTEAELLTLLHTPVGTAGKKADASLILADQLIAAKLDIANGTDPTPVASTIADADHLLSGFAGKLPYSVPTASLVGQAMVADAAVLESYNSGVGCVPLSTTTTTHHFHDHLVHGADHDNHDVVDDHEQHHHVYECDNGYHSAVDHLLDDDHQQHDDDSSADHDHHHFHDHYDKDHHHTALHDCALYLGDCPHEQRMHWAGDSSRCDWGA